MKPTPKVYVPNMGCHDLQIAEQYGEIIYLTEGRLKLSSVGYLYRVMNEILSKSSPNDYLLISGPTIANVVATSILVNLHKKLNTLIYIVDGKGQGRYLVRSINLDIGE